MSIINLKKSDFKIHSSIIESLCDYINLKPVDYALLLSGKWGTGKTYLIREFIKQAKDQEFQIDYISLNGLSTKEELCEMLLALGTPLNKLLNLGARFIKGMNVTLPFVGINVSNSLKGSKKKIKTSLTDFIKHKKETPLVVDDLERCKIPLDELFGVFSTLLEEWNIPLIIIGDEDLVNGEEYALKKEKVIGSTLILHAESEYIIKTQFIKNDWFCKNKLEDTITNIFIKFFDEFHKENLRAFKIALRESLIILNKVDNEFKQNTKFLKLFTQIIVASKYALQLGLFRKTFDSKGLINEEVEHLENTGFSPETFEKTLKKVGISPVKAYLRDFMFFSFNAWENLLFGEPFDWDHANNLISKSEFFFTNPRKTWEYLYASDHYNDDIVNKNKELLLKEINEFKYTDLQEIRMVFNMLEKENDKDLFICEQLKEESTFTKEAMLNNLVNQFKEYVEKLFNEEKLEVKDFDNIKKFPDSYSSSRFFNVDNDDSFYSRTKDYIKEVVIRLRKCARRKEQVSILTSIQNKDFITFINSISTYEERKGNFIFTPRFISCDMFLEISQTAPVELLMELLDKLNERYYHGDHKILLNENWLQYEQDEINKIVNALFEYCKASREHLKNRVYVLLYIRKILEKVTIAIKEQAPLVNISKDDPPLSEYFLEPPKMLNLHEM